MGFPCGSDGKESYCNEEDPGLIPESGRSPGVGHGNPHQYSCWENLTDRVTWKATVHEVAKESDMIKSLSTKQDRLFKALNPQ